MSGTMSTISAVVLLAGSASEAPVSELLVEHGFEVTPVIGGSLVVTGDRDAFVALLGDERVVRNGDTVSFSIDGESRTELSSGELPAALAADVVGIEIQRAPDFGPNDF